MYNSYMQLENKEAIDFDTFIEYTTIYHTITKDNTLLENEIILSAKNRVIDFISNVDGIEYFIEVKGRNNTSTKYDGHILEVKKYESFLTKAALKLNFNYDGENSIELLELCKLNNYQLLYYNYFTDDVLYVWDIVDIMLNNKYTEKSYYAPKASTKGFSGYNLSTNKNTILLKNETAKNKYEHFFGCNKDLFFSKFRLYIQKVRDRSNG